MFLSNPYTGIGMDSYGLYFKEFRNPEYPLLYGFEITSSNAHNTIIQLFATGGIILGISYLGLLAIILIRGIRLVKNAESLGISTISFRFFNVGGALKNKAGKWLRIKHEGATHLIPSILHSSASKPLLINGNDWPTSDGTPVRDFVHITDLVNALVKSLTHLEKPGNTIINIGTATGSTVLEVVKAAESALSRKINYKFSSRRAGDSYALVTSNQVAKDILGWVPIKNLVNILEDANAELIANN
jgi:UDP-glucose 4-epimerase